MKKAAICLLLFSLVLFSFKTDRKKMITHKWRAISAYDSWLDSLFITAQISIDTIDRNDDLDNLYRYGTTNADSIKPILQFQLDSLKASQLSLVRSTVFNFRKDSLIITVENNTESCKWELDNKGKLVLSNGMDLEIMTLSDTLMKLKLIADSGYYCIYKLHPEN